MSAAPTVRAVIARHCRELLADPLLHGDPTLRDIAAQCHQPLRVLLVGNVSTGKSTLLNALIAGPLAATAFEETTSSVTWYHGPELTDPVLPDPGHRSVTTDFPLAGRVMLGDSPGLNTLSDNPRETLRMLGGSDLTGAAAAFVCALVGGRVDQWAEGLEELAAFSAGPFDLVGNIVAVMAKVDEVPEAVEDIERRVSGDTTATFRFAAVNQLMAAAARTGAVDDRIVATLDRLRTLPVLHGRSAPAWDRLAEEAGTSLPPGHLKALEQTVGAPAWLPALVAATAGMTTTGAVAEQFERMSRIRSLEAVLSDLADDSDLFTSTAAVLRLRRLAARLRPGPAALVRARLADLTATMHTSGLHRRAAARLVRHTDVGSGLTEHEREAAQALLRWPDAEADGGASPSPASPPSPSPSPSPASPPSPSPDTSAADGDTADRTTAAEVDAGAVLARWTAYEADPFRDSRSREVAALVIETARHRLRTTTRLEES
ncbi:GTPase domain-containing protein [Streptomyces uncialis]|uniref:GTPase domain-containing protein n=1 Tax=Streptomyces uncialis TaxID=1048205 RepID=UPI00224CDFE8|nr:GTPase domain-containing protein [Streptomyces uncialis]MCX4658783.1 GTPase domain-containing protein [Streptomyces uncialis]